MKELNEKYERLSKEKGLKDKISSLKRDIGWGTLDSNMRGVYSAIKNTEEHLKTYDKLYEETKDKTYRNFAIEEYRDLKRHKNDYKQMEIEMNKKKENLKELELYQESEYGDIRLMKW